MARHLIDGRSVDGTRTLDVVNPATGAAFAVCPNATHDQLGAALAAATRAFAGPWAGDEAARRAVIRRMGDVAEAQADEIDRLICLEQGKPLGMAIAEAHGAAAIFRLYADDPIPREVLRDADGVRTTLERRPLGVTAAITPWNYPIATLAMKVAPALLVGNTVVAKPSPFTPLASLALADAVRPVVPPGVLNVLGGDDEVGACLAAHPATRKITFTGSIDTGKAIARAAAADLKRLTLELGGNDAAIVLDDADPSVVVPSIFWNAFFNSGQICMAIKRVYVHDRIHDALVAALVDLAAAIVVGDPFDPATQLGPVSTAPQLAHVIALVDDARRRGATIGTGGRQLERPGFFYPPTIVSEVPPDAPLVVEEQFGPVLPVVRYQDVDHALTLANGTRHGLGGSVWTADPGRGADVARRLECGTAWVNTHMDLGHDAPFGGRKWSGVGHENGPWGIDGYCDLQVVKVVG